MRHQAHSDERQGPWPRDAQLWAGSSSSHPTVALVMGAVQTQRGVGGQFYSRKAIKEGFLEGFLEEAVLELSLRS